MVDFFKPYMFVVLSSHTTNFSRPKQRCNTVIESTCTTLELWIKCGGNVND